MALFHAGMSKDELFGQFFAALEKIHYLKTMPDGNDDPSQLDKASQVFHDALNVWFTVLVFAFVAFLGTSIVFVVARIVYYTFQSYVSGVSIWCEFCTSFVISVVKELLYFVWN